MHFMGSYTYIHSHGRCCTATYKVLYACEKKHFIICHIWNWFEIFCGCMHELKAYENPLDASGTNFEKKNNRKYDDTIKFHNVSSEKWVIDMVNGILIVDTLTD